MTAADPLRGNAHLVDSLGNALRSGEHGLSTVPGLLKRVLSEESWREFVTQRGEHVEHERFADFVTTPPLKGLGSTVDFVRRIVADDSEADDLLNGQLENDGKQGARTDLVSNIHEVKRPAGTTRDRAIRKLRADAPELHSEVVAGNLSAHAAMVQAGFRKRTFSVPAEDPERIAATLRRQLDPDSLAQIAKLLEQP